jgi:hypothetical protein
MIHPEPRSRPPLMMPFLLLPLLLLLLLLLQLRHPAGPAWAVGCWADTPVPALPRRRRQQQY